MTDIVERLRAGSWANAPWEPEYKVPPTSLHLEAADEIERLKAELDTIGQMIGNAIDVAVFKQAKRERRGANCEKWQGRLK